MTTDAESAILRKPKEHSRDSREGSNVANILIDGMRKRFRESTIPVLYRFWSDVPRTNNNCESNNSRLSKCAQESHLNIYALIVLFRDEQLNKEAHILRS